MKRFCKIHFAILLLSTVLLNGCFRSTPVDTATETAKNSIVALEKSLKDDCKTEGINEQIKAIKTTITNIHETCLAEKEILKEQKTKWQILFLGAIGIIVLLLWRKFRI